MNMTVNITTPVDREVRLQAGTVSLSGQLALPASPLGTVIFAHGSGSSRHSPRNQFVVGTLRRARLGALLFDLLTPEEERAERYTRNLRFNIDLLAQRLTAAARWTSSNLAGPIGFFGASTGAGAALEAAAGLGRAVRAVVSRGGRPDLAAEALPRVQAPTLLLVGGLDEAVIDLNRQALAGLSCEKEMRIIPGASHLFEEPGALDTVAGMAADWFARHFSRTD